MCLMFECFVYWLKDYAGASKMVGVKQESAFWLKNGNVEVTFLQVVTIVSTSGNFDPTNGNCG